MSAAPGHFQNTAPSGGIWHSLNRLLFVLIVLVADDDRGYRFLPEVSKRRDQQTRVEQLKAEVEKERQLLARNTRDRGIAQARSANTSASIARDRLDLMKEGETIYRLDPPKPAGQGADAAESLSG